MSIKNFILSFSSWIGFRTGTGQVYVLGLPVASLWATWSAVLVTFVYYFFSKYPDLSVWDSPLIAMVAIQGGLGHPPGYPLHTMLGNILSKLPGVDPLVGVKLLSIIPGALMCIPILSLASQIRGVESSRSPMGNWFSTLTVVALCIHPTLWDPSTRVEVYTLSAFLAAWGIACLGRDLNSFNQKSKDIHHKGPKGFFFAGLALGASASVHPIVAAVTASAAFTAIIIVTFLRPSGWKVPLKLIAGGAMGLLPYLWIPMVGNQTDRWIWGSPTSLGAMWDFLRAKDFAPNLGPESSSIMLHLFDWLGWAVTSGTLFFAVLGFAGWFLLGKRGSLGRSGPLALLLAVLFICNNKIWVPENPDYLGYLCGPLFICSAGGIALIYELCMRKGFRFRFIAMGFLLLVLFIGLFAPPAFHTRTRHLDRVARLQAIGALNESPRNGILLVGSDHLTWPIIYLQEIEHVRRDVVVVCEGMAGFPWYWNHIYHLHPDLRSFPVDYSETKNEIIRRFLAAHPDRSLGFESVGTARRAGAKIYGVGWILLDRPIDPEITKQINEKINQAATMIGTGSPDGIGTLSLVSYLRCEGLWRLGRPKIAYQALLAGVPPSMRPSLQPPDERWKRILPLRQPIPPGLSQTKGLGDPHRNLALAKYLAESEEAMKKQENDTKTTP